ncbi:hypothetical protein LY76DRAFT_189855 [Colletotrichum caudatum]|nr:hypothetical protein LY76DRAFT_189855 [Colletotrichum caudatum]
MIMPDIFRVGAVRFVIIKRGFLPIHHACAGWSLMETESRPPHLPPFTQSFQVFLNIFILIFIVLPIPYRVIEWYLCRARSRSRFSFMFVVVV